MDWNPWWPTCTRGAKELTLTSPPSPMQSLYPIQIEIQGTQAFETSVPKSFVHTNTILRLAGRGESMLLGHEHVKVSSVDPAEPGDTKL